VRPVTFLSVIYTSKSYKPHYNQIFAVLGKSPV
jgi:hypothetical protein